MTDTEVINAPTEHAVQLAAAQPQHAIVAQAEPASDSRALMQMIDRAMSRADFDVDKLERLLAVKKAWEADEARKAYHSAMAAFKKNPPTISKDKHVHYVGNKGAVDYDHATLGNVVKRITAALSEHGISASWDPQRRDARVWVTCTLTHALGHSQSVTLDGPADESGGKNAIQAVGSTITYLERYTLLAITGLAVEDQDDDGAGAGAGDKGKGNVGAEILQKGLDDIAAAADTAALTKVWESSITDVQAAGRAAYDEFKAAWIAKRDALKKAGK